MKLLQALALLTLFIPCIVGAVPSGTAVSAVGNNNVTFTADNFDAAGGWFQYGMAPTTLNVWTITQAGGGSITWTEYGSPLTSGETYYVSGCDVTGCDPIPAEFSMQNATPLPATTFGYLITNATENRFNVIKFLPNIMLPYAWLFPQSAIPLGISITVALVLFAVYYGLAVRTRGVAVPVIMGVIGAPYLLYQNQGMNLGIPVEFQAIAQGIFYASLAGIILVILRK
ncbi:MAG: hypothetical protein M0Q91_05260 [Methanoregula sp.]|jgi:hypothetical protein|nr:hypothetical protein [Methanoregula sp.]